MFLNVKSVKSQFLVLKVWLSAGKLDIPMSWMASWIGYHPRYNPKSHSWASFFPIKINQYGNKMAQDGHTHFWTQPFDGIYRCGLYLATFRPWLVHSCRSFLSMGSCGFSHRRQCLEKSGSAWASRKMQLILCSDEDYSDYSVTTTPDHLGMSQNPSTLVKPKII